MRDLLVQQICGSSFSGVKEFRKKRLKRAISMTEPKQKQRLRMNLDLPAPRAAVAARALTRLLMACQH
jgi:hypothetical protein